MKKWPEQTSTFAAQVAIKALKPWPKWYSN